MLYRLSYVGFWKPGRTRPCQERVFPKPMEHGDPTPEDLLRVRVEKDALPRAGFSGEKAVGE
jgi:hypothetical protein